MDGKVVVVTGASGALGKVVAEAALARGARVAGVDHAATQVAATENRIELGGVDLSDPEQAKNAIDAVAALFAVAPLPFVAPAVRECHNALAVEAIVAQLAVVALAVGPCINPLAALLVIAPLSFVALSI